MNGIGASRDVTQLIQDQQVELRQLLLETHELRQQNFVDRRLGLEVEDAGVEEPTQLPLYFLGIWILVWGLGSFFYYGFSELLLRGQTIGKRSQQIRVVRDGGFSLDAGSPPDRGSHVHSKFQRDSSDGTCRIDSLRRNLLQ